jgi:hypothetical protein
VIKVSERFGKVHVAAMSQNALASLGQCDTNWIISVSNVPLNVNEASIVDVFTKKNLASLNAT